MMPVRYMLCLFVALILSGAATAHAQIVVTDDVTSSATWTAENEYVLDGLIFIDSGVTLTIEPGTVIKARAQGNITTGDGASALVVRRGGRLVADGLRTSPIIFTSEFDDVADPSDLTEADRGQWGGVILLGEAPTNNNAALTQIEGIPPELEAQYGCEGAGCDPNDDSGILRYVSIRHGGFSISGQPGDEINGLTMGAVGDGTTIEYVEVFANLDDCFEWFGGTVNTKYLVGAFCGDDTFDYDQGYKGLGQFWFAVQGADAAGRGAEMDGVSPSGGSVDNTSFSQVIVSNATFIGSGVSASPEGDGNDFALRFRENAGGQYWNSIFTDFTGQALRIDEGDTDPDAVDRFRAGDLAIANGLFFGFGGGSTFADLIRTADSFAGELATALAGANQIADPQLAGIAREVESQGLDPRPLEGSVVLTTGTEGFDSALDGDFFEEVSYIGAFGGELWIESWTAHAQNEVLGDLTDNRVAVEEVDGELPTRIVLEQNYPNPFNPQTTIEFGLDSTQPVRLAVYDLLGREVTVLVDGVQPAGTYRATFDGTDLATGLYVYRLSTDRGSVSKTMMLVK